MEIQALKDLAKEMGIQEGLELTAFLRDERAMAREEHNAEQGTVAKVYANIRGMSGETPHSKNGRGESFG